MGVSHNDKLVSAAFFEFFILKIIHCITFFLCRFTLSIWQWIGLACIPVSIFKNIVNVIQLMCASIDVVNVVRTYHTILKLTVATVESRGVVRTDDIILFPRTPPSARRVVPTTLARASSKLLLETLLRKPAAVEAPVPRAQHNIGHDR